MSKSTTLIVCPACGQKNRIETDKGDKKPVCGKCKAPLPVGGAVEVTDDDFEQAVIRSELPVLVDFWAPWCGPCRMVGPIVEELAQEYLGRIIVVKVNTDNNRQVAAKYKIMGIPTLMLFKGGEVIERITGAVPKAHLEDVLRKHLQDA